jgi:Rrf2 family protein
LLTSKAKYALQAMHDLAEHGANGPIFIGDIAARQGIPKRFLEAILLQLRRGLLVVSHRGKNGGYSLSRPPHKISYAEIIRCIDGPLALAPCASLNAYRRCDNCLDEKTCVIKTTLIKVREATAKILESTKLA